MRRRRAVSSLAAAACVALLLSGAASSALPLACLAAILIDTAWLSPRGLRPAPSVLIATQVLLAFSFVCLALLRDPPVDFLTLLLVASAPLVVVRLFHPDSDFNDFLIVILSLLLVVGSAAVAPGPLPIAITAIYVLVGCHALKALAAPAGGPRGGLRYRLEQPPGWWSAAPAFATHHLAVGGLVLGALFYLVAPRPEVAIETPGRPGRLLGAGPRPREGRTTAALSDFPREVTLGDIGRIKRRPYPALAVEIRARGRPYDPREGERSMLLLRVRAWEEYAPAARRWVQARSPARPLRADGVLEAGPTELDWSFDVLGYDGKTLFLPPRARRVWGAGGALASDRMGIVTSSVPVFAYAVASARPVRADDLPACTPDLRERNLLLVPDAVARVLSPRLPDVPKGDLAAAAGAVTEFFGTNGFRYTLDLPPAIGGADDPLLAFLEQREGHCELYATTACLFLRLMGVPARVAGGLRCAERLGPGRYQARFSNAHAWVEVPCLDVGFVALDFTPADASAQAPHAGPARDTEEEVGGRGGEEGAVLDWNDPFAYGPDEQDRFVGWLGDRLLAWPVLVLAGAFLLFLVLPSVVAAVRGRTRSPLRVTAPKGQRRSTLAFYARWLKECAAKGHVRSRVQTPREFLFALPAALQAEGRGITEEFERRRYGPPAPP